MTENRKTYFEGIETVRTFKSFNGQRGLKKQQVKRIMEAMIRGELMQYVYINRETKDIIDGQHRIAAMIAGIDSGRLSKDYRLPVCYYDIEEREELHYAMTYSNNNMRWTNKNTVEGYSVNNDSYRKLAEWCDRHPMCVGSKGSYRYQFALSCILGKKISVKNNPDIVLTEKDFERGEIVYREISSLFAALGDGVFCKCSTLSEIPPVYLEYRDKLKMGYENILYQFKHHKLAILRKPMTNKADWVAVFDFIKGLHDREK